MDFAPGGAGGGTKTMYTWMVSSCDPLGTAPACTLHAALSSSTLLLLLGRCLQHRGGEPERAKGA